MILSTAAIFMRSVEQCPRNLRKFCIFRVREEVIGPFGFVYFDV